MKNLSFFAQSTLFSLALVSFSLTYSEPTTIEKALNDYKLAAISGDLNQYTNACGQLIATTKNVDTETVLHCLNVVKTTYPKHNHTRRIVAASICPKGFFSFLNTVTHALSTRGDSTSCSVTSTLATLEATGVTAAACIATLVAVGALAAEASNQESQNITPIALFAAMGLSTLATCEWLTNYLNKTASEEKTHLDDMYKLTIQSLQSLVISN